jgi:two-component system, chemotaxis family, protein-glutamate methylesterase/glutaminase
MSQDLLVTCEPSHRPSQLAGAVAIVASAGGIPALVSLLGSLPYTFPLPIFVAQHLARGPSGLDIILGRYCPLSVTWAVHGNQPRKGQVYLVPPGMRLSIAAAGFHVSRLAPSSSSWLASGDHLISSVAVLYGARSIGIVLSGTMQAGIEGLRAVKACGGFAIAQDRTSSEWFEMPSAAIDLAKAEIVMPPQRMASMLNIIAEWWQDGSPSRGGLSSPNNP